MNSLRLPVLALLALLLSLACDAPQSALDPRTSDARDIASMWWFMLAIGTAVFVLVVALTALALFRPRRTPDTASEPLKPILALGVALPAVVIVILMGMMIAIMVSDDHDEEPLVIEIVGHMWWWEVNYPDYGFSTANEIHVPLGRTVRLEMTSNDVIHSFWVPQLQGKLDLIPGQTNHLNIRVHEPGFYRGQCAEFCGIQHANMFVFVIANEDFDAWAEGNQQPVTMPEDPFLRRGWEVFFANSCASCHALQGTDAQGTAGPDLSNMGGRRTLGSGVMQNNAGNLAGWILDPHERKRGNFMPPTGLADEDLDALVDFLLSLQ